MRRRVCERCLRWYEVGIFARDRTRRFCSEICRKRAERARARARRTPPKAIGDDLGTQ